MVVMGYATMRHNDKYTCMYAGGAWWRGATLRHTSSSSINSQHQYRWHARTYGPQASLFGTASSSIAISARAFSNVTFAALAISVYAMSQCANDVGADCR